MCVGGGGCARWGVCIGLSVFGAIRCLTPSPQCGRIPFFQVVIPYLKFDIETSEWPVLRNVIDDGTLVNVQQVTFETHVPKKSTVNHLVEYYRLIHSLEAAGFKRWFARHAGGGFWIQHDQSYINTNFCVDDI